MSVTSRSKRSSPVRAVSSSVAMTTLGNSSDGSVALGVAFMLDSTSPGSAPSASAAFMGLSSCRTKPVT
ncbi:hypothetical protein [Nonomuraea jabiensis]|uniref:hypothetical protein n=1 Tax=Nonomuraea jabiensis TaxID=882448 RepID=UPI003D76279C